MKILHATKFDSSLSSNLAKRDMGYAKRKKRKDMREKKGKKKKK